ncbi:bacteriorhodopsin [Deinococcus marmoris]|uniref:bacteriorhodopsin n=1 Tax=Deinococcus marmoris TaxID=249408 RepID=UPI00068CA4F7|nr:bacteriorhodopsin [Deinococcus marmoris]
MTESIWQGIYITCMALGALLFIAWSRQPRGVPASEYLIATAIPVWSGLAYLGLLLGQGTVEVDGQTTYYARYIDWAVTTPLLLTALALTAMFRQARKNYTLIGALIFSDLVMIGSGLVADLSTGSARTVWFLCGVVAFLIVLGLIWGPVRALAARDGADLKAVYDKSAGFLSVLWVAYPTIWALGPSGIDLLSQPVETALFVIVPVLSKVGFSIVDLSGLRGLRAVEAGRAAAV